MPTPELNKALAAFQASLPAIAKGETAEVPTKTGGKYTYTYADLSDVSDIVMPLLGKNGLAFTAFPGTDSDGRLVLDYALTHESGEEKTGQFPLWLMLPERVTAQLVGGFVTYARRYCLCAVTGVAPGGEDTDGAATAKVKVDRPQRTRAKIPGPGHERLQPRRQPGGRPAERGPIPPGQDLWQDQPAGRYDETPAEERNGSIDGRQRSIIMAHLGKLRREERLGKLAGLAGREVESTNDLSWVEADRVIKAIEAEKEVAEQDAVAEAGTP